MGKIDTLQEPVIVIESNSDFRKTLVAVVEGLNLSCKAYNGPEEALAEIGNVQPFLIVTSFKMTEMDVLEFQQGVRKVLPSLPMIFLVHAPEKEIAISSSVHSCHFVDKPIERDVLKKLIRGIAEKRVEYIETERIELIEITQLFVEESYDLLKDADQLVLRLEEEPIDPSVVNTLFRKVHSVKGGASALPNAKTLNVLMHEFESVLSNVKKGEIVPNSSSINLFLESNDL